MILRDLNKMEEISIGDVDGEGNRGDSQNIESASSFSNEGG